ncbi:hypothetical protein GCM10010532_113890 [Dactylosporangium siamense]|uniref:Uncharacterized protein n=1 Tax=Dactylosporangium siamense TaxID=685454 RepID=A0A919UC28_9ACTN|nr:hypothetical protein Dsi01nite_079280 [Dactylosporangium siamense]
MVLVAPHPFAEDGEVGRFAAGVVPAGRDEVELAEAAIRSAHRSQGSNGTGTSGGVIAVGGSVH